MDPVTIIIPAFFIIFGLCVLAALIFAFTIVGIKISYMASPIASLDDETKYHTFQTSLRQHFEKLQSSRMIESFSIQGQDIEAVDGMRMLRLRAVYKNDGRVVVRYMTSSTRTYEANSRAGAVFIFPYAFEFIRNHFFSKSIMKGFH